MRKTHIFALLWVAVLGVLPGTASHAQSQFPPTLPPNTVYGRLGAGVPGPAQAIPFGTLGTQISPFVLASLPPYNVSASASDNSAGILSAIAAVKALGGGTVYLPPGVLKACSQMQWTADGISISGAGEGTSPYTPVTSAGTVIQACSSFSGTNQVLLGANSSSAVNHAMSISNLSFDGNGVASVGLLLRDVVEARVDNVNFYHHSGSGVTLNGTSGNSVRVTGQNVFTNIHIKERNNPGGLNTNGITCTLTTQNTWTSVFIEHADGDGISVGENCDQQTWTTLFTFRANSETGYAIHLTGDSSSVIGNWNLNGVLTSAQWNMACCSAANTAWTMQGLNTGNFNTGITESNFLTGTGAAGVEYIDMGGNLVTQGTITAAGAIKTTASTASSSTTTGAVIVTGGVGIGGAIHGGSTLNLDTTAANIATFGNASLGGSNTPTSISIDASYANSCGSAAENKINLLFGQGGYGIGVCAGEVWFGSGGSYAWYSNAGGSPVATLSSTGVFSGLGFTGSGSTPTANSCTGFALSTGSTDFAGKVTFNSATTCSISFGASFTNTPFCVVTPGSAASTVEAVPSTGGLAVTFGTANTAFQYICAGT